MNAELSRTLTHKLRLYRESGSPSHSLLMSFFRYIGDHEDEINSQDDIPRKFEAILKMEENIADNNCINKFLSRWSEFFNGQLSKSLSFIEDSAIRQVASEYRDDKKDAQKEKINVFTLISDLYYRENFHSDILSTFLDVTAIHNHGSLFLDIFIDMLNEQFSDKVHINKADYTYSQAEREDSGIDILIYSKESRHCIIVENKINNAVDMPRQLPRYFEIMHGQDYVIDAIVYLPLDRMKSPDKSTWDERDKRNVDPLLCILPAYSRSNQANLVDGWLRKCTAAATESDCKSILGQYGDLICKLSKQDMNNAILTKFYDSLLEGDNLDTAQAISSMMKEIPVLMADRLVERYKDQYKPFNVWKYKPNFCGIRFWKDKIEYKIDVWIDVDNLNYKIYVFNQTNRPDGFPWGDILESLKDFTKTGDEYHYLGYSFFDEAKVCKWIDQILSEIREKVLF